MRYAILLGISTHGEFTDFGEAMIWATEVSVSHPTRLVRIIDTHDDSISFEIRAGQPEVKA